MEKARLVYLKGMNLALFIKGSFDLIDILNIKNSFITECDVLVADHQGCNIKAKFSKVRSDKTISITHTSPNITVVWE